MREQASAAVYGFVIAATAIFQHALSLLDWAMQLVAERNSRKVDVCRCARNNPITIYQDREDQFMITLCGFGVSNYYNKLKLILLEKRIPFRGKLVYPWQRESYRELSPLGKIPFIETEHGGLSESQVILDYLEERFPQTPLYPKETFSRAKCRELIQHLELNSEWVARRLYKEAFFGGQVSEETKSEARERLALGLKSVAQLSPFSPYIFGATFTAADCVAYVHFVMIKHTSLKIFGEDMLEKLIPKVAAYMEFMGSRPHIRTMMAEREAAMEAFLKIDVQYDG